MDIRDPCTLANGLVLYAMTFQIMEASTIADSINLLATEVGPLLHLFTGQMCLAIESLINMGSLQIFLCPSALQEIEILVFKYRLIQWLL